MKDRILSIWPLDDWRSSQIVVAVSGGPDSMCLLECLSQIAPDKSQLLVVHCNHMMRGTESDEDEAFVLHQSRIRGLECRVHRFDQHQKSNPSEDNLRRVRYAYLCQTANQRRANWIALGHNADDNIETFFHRLLRGTGLRGLRGIPPKRIVTLPDKNVVQLVRPLLHCTRGEIVNWMESHQIPYRLDSSNAQTHYTRNRIRHELMPVLDNISGIGWRRRVLSSINHLADVQIDLDEQVRRFLETLDNNPLAGHPTFEIPLNQWNELSWTAIREILVEVWHRQDWPLREMGAQHWNRIRRLLATAKLSSHPKRMDLPGSLQLEIRQGVFRITSSKGTRET